MNIPSTFRLLFSTRFDGFFSEQEPFKLGDKLTGRVLEVKGNGLALFDFNRMKAWAEVKFPVKEGDVLHVRVVEKGTQLKLKLLSSEQKIPSNTNRILSITEFPTEKVLAELKSGLKRIISPEGRMREKTSIPRHIEVSITRIASHFEFLNTGKSVSELSSQLKLYVENSGAFFEKRIENAIEKLFQVDKKIFSKSLHQFPEIKEIINRDLKPNLLILKGFFDGKEMKSLKKATTSLGEIKPLINRLMEDIGAQQSKAIAAHQKQGGAREVVYPNPSKSIHAERISPKEILRAISKLVPRLHAFFQHSGTNVDEKIQHAVAKLSDTAEMVSTKGAVVILDAKEIVARDLLQGDLKSHLRLLQDFFDNKENTFKTFSTKELETIKLPLDRLLANFEFLQNHAERISPKEILRAISKLVPRLHAFFQHSGTNVDEKIQHAVAKLSDTAEMVSTKGAVVILDAKEIVARDLLQGDLKSHLRLLQDFFDNKEQTFKAFGTKDHEIMKTLLDRLLMEMDTQQYKGETTQQRQKPEPLQVITYSLPLGEEDQSGKLKIYYSKRTKDASKEGFRMSLLLQMARIGHIRTDFSLMDKDLRITFFVNDHKIKTYINDHSDEIKKRLADHFNSLMLEVVISEKKIEEFETEHMISESTRLLDVRA